jgi:hypothetical protein
LNATRRRSNGRSVGAAAPVHAAITLTPGAVMSGCELQCYIKLMVQSRIGE